MTDGIDLAPWWARWASGLVAQCGLAWAQWLIHSGEASEWSVIAAILAQGVVGVAMVYGPSRTSRLVKTVGESVRK